MFASAMQGQCAASYYGSVKSGPLPAVRANLRGCRRVHSRLPVTHAVKTDTAVTEVLKNELSSALEASKGNIQADGISELVARLVECNPTEAPARNAAALTGNWKVLGQDPYPDSISRTEDGESVLTLGRAAFNMFTPTDLVVALGLTMNPVQPSQEDGSLDYAVSIPIRTMDDRADPPVTGNLRNWATATPHPEKPERLIVSFTGGRLVPSGSSTTEQMAVWEELFKQQGQSVGVGAMLARTAARVFMGVSPGKWVEDQSIEYSMSKAPEGYLDVLYLDADMRITVGNRGSYFVVQRV